MKIKLKLAIEGMQCSSCATILEARLGGLKGMKNVSVSSKNKIADFEFDENLLSEENIKNVIIKLGYKTP